MKTGTVIKPIVMPNGDSFSPRSKFERKSMGRCIVAGLVNDEFKRRAVGDEIHRIMVCDPKPVGGSMVGRAANKLLSGIMGALKR